MGVGKDELFFIGLYENIKRSSTILSKGTFTLFMEPATVYCNDNGLRDKRIRYIRLTDPFGLV